MINRCKQCGVSGKGIELRGTSNRGIPNGLWCRTCFEIGSPGKSYLQWKNAMTVAEYESADREWMRKI